MFLEIKAHEPIGLDNKAVGQVIRPLSGLIRQYVLKTPIISGDCVGISGYYDLTDRGGWIDR